MKNKSQSSIKLLSIDKKHNKLHSTRPLKVEEKKQVKGGSNKCGVTSDYGLCRK